MLLDGKYKILGFNRHSEGFEVFINDRENDKIVVCHIQNDTMLGITKLIAEYQRELIERNELRSNINV